MAVFVNGRMLIMVMLLLFFFPSPVNEVKFCFL